jgi:hypothetical protein
MPTAKVKAAVHSHVFPIFAEKHKRVYIIIIVIIIIIIIRQGLSCSGTSSGVGWQLQIYGAQKREDLIYTAAET